jgi:hypothetical protein
VANGQSEWRSRGDGGQGHEDPEETATRSAWDGYLQGLTAPRGPLSPFLVKQVLDLWESLDRSLRLAGRPLDPPHATVTPAQGLALSWDRGRHHFEIEIDPDSTYGWFYMDRASDLRSGEEHRALGLSAPDRTDPSESEMISCLRRTVG